MVVDYWYSWFNSLDWCIVRNLNWCSSVSNNLWSNCEGISFKLWAVFSRDSTVNTIQATNILFHTSVISSHLVDITLYVFFRGNNNVFSCESDITLRRLCFETNHLFNRSIGRSYRCTKFLILSACRDLCLNTLSISFQSLRRIWFSFCNNSLFIDCQVCTQ